ncbi:hypothetical protein B5S31_g3599 [[Candida] boidinii]|nr:hypothetical protein B5S31_g3599 [[Candida] boidinii]OWB81077.1 hypothetical protein B5S32_g5427 [[Candida] boidinii]GMF66741.1 unnamed protein product [[Candida] boidinii]
MIFKLISTSIGLAEQTVSTGVYSAVRYVTNDNSSEAQDLSQVQRKELKMRLKDLTTFYIPGQTCRKCGGRTKDSIRKSSRKDRRYQMIPEYCDSCNESYYNSTNQVHEDVPINYTSMNNQSATSASAPTPAPAPVPQQQEQQQQQYEYQSDNDVPPPYEDTIGDSSGIVQQGTSSSHIPTDSKTQ